MCEANMRGEGFKIRLEEDKHFDVGGEMRGGIRRRDRRGIWNVGEGGQRGIGRGSWKREIRDGYGMWEGR